MKLAKTHVYSARDSNFFSPTARLIFGMPYVTALSNLRPSIALNPESIAFISVIFVLIVLFDYIFLIFFFSFGGVGWGPMLVHGLLPLGPGYTVCLMFLCSFYVFIF